MPLHCGVTTACFLRLISGTLIFCAPALGTGKRLHSHVQTLEQDNKKPKYELVIRLPNSPREKAILPHYKMVREAINAKNYHLAHQLITSETTLCPPISESRLNLSFLFTLFVNAEHYLNMHAYTLVNKLLEQGELQAEEECIHTDKIITTAFRMLLSIIKPYRNEHLSTFINTTILKMLEAGCNPLLQGTIPKQVTINPEHPLHQKITYAENFYQCKDDVQEYTTLIRKCFEYNFIDLTLKIAIARKNDRLLWALLQVMQEKGYERHQIDLFFKKPEFVHHCSRECLHFLPIFNMMRKLKDITTTQTTGDLNFWFT